MGPEKVSIDRTLQPVRAGSRKVKARYEPKNVCRFLQSVSVG